MDALALALDRVFSKRQIPNALTVLRIALLPLLLWLFYGQRYVLALAVFLLIGVTDLLDGFLARRYNWLTRLGAILDPVADKLVMLVSYFMLWERGVLPWWLWAVVLGRDLVIISGSLICRLVLGPYPMQPTLLSKLTTLFQLGLIFVALCEMAMPGLPDWLMHSMILLVLGLTISSGANYVWIWGRKVLSPRR